MKAKSLTSQERRLALPRGSYVAQRWLAAEEADELRVWASIQRCPACALPWVYAGAALQNAVDMAKMIRAVAPYTACEFVGHQVRLNEYIQRLKALKIPAYWPIEPKGCAFAWFTERSSLEVAIHFAQTIWTADCVASQEVIVHGERPRYANLQVAPNADIAFDQWRDRLISELRDYTLVGVWPHMADIHRDYGLLRIALENEYLRACEIAEIESSKGGTATAKPSGLSVISDDLQRLRLEAGGILIGAWIVAGLAGDRATKMMNCTEAELVAGHQQELRELCKFHLDERFEEFRSHVDPVREELIAAYRRTKALGLPNIAGAPGSCAHEAVQEFVRQVLITRTGLTGSGWQRHVERAHALAAVDVESAKTLLDAEVEAAASARIDSHRRNAESRRLATNSVHPGRDTIAKTQTITAAVAVKRYHVSAKTIREGVKCGVLTDHRPPNHARNTRLLVDEAEIAARYPPRGQ